MGKTPIISCEIAGEKTKMALDMGSEVTILQEWWFNEYLMASVDCLEMRRHGYGWKQPTLRCSHTLGTLQPIKMCWALSLRTKGF